MLLRYYERKDKKRKKGKVTSCFSEAVSRDDAYVSQV